MRRKWRVKSQLARALEDPEYKKRFDADYEAFKVEVQLLLALERKHWSYADLAHAIGSQKSHVSRDLKGRGLGAASISRISRIAEALGLKFVPLCIPKDKFESSLPLLRKLAST